ncbi:MAG: hypothetical protein IID63_06840 [candidate division Zixibacteria bacterium]|nr:hypothetical protein [candidate division Zixibacteria bacterium]
MDDFSSRIVNSQASERVTKVLRSDANKNREKNSHKKQDEKENKENKQAIEDQLILSSSRENIDNAELRNDKDKEEQEKKNLLQPQEATEDEENDSKHVDIKA